MRVLVALLTGSMLALFSSRVVAEDAPAKAKIKVGVVTAGHAFAQKAFFKLFQGHDDIEYTHLPQKDQSEVFEDIADWPYDVLVLYNMTQKISEKRRENFLKLLEQGVGLVVMHHAIANYTDWPEYRAIIGAAYFLEETVMDGTTYPRSEYTHGVDIPVHIEDPEHPITRGLKDFTVNDEVYRKWVCLPGNHLLLTTEQPESDRSLAWVKGYRNAKVFFIQLGHGETIFTDDNYRRLVGNGIRWTAGRLEEKAGTTQP